MRILYLSSSYVPSRRASSMQIMKMCAALARAGHQVELVTKACSERQEPEVRDDFQFHNVPASFRITKLPRPARRGGGIVYAAAVAALARKRLKDVDLVFCRDILGGAIAAKLGMPLLFEAHTMPRDRVSALLHRRMFRAPSFRRLVVISEALRASFADKSMLPAAERVVVAHDAADPMEIASHAVNQPEQLRVGYVGHLHEGRGVEVVAELARRFPSVSFDVVGGHADAVEAWRAKNTSTNLVFHGFVQPARLREFYGQFDILLMPHQRRVAGQSGKDISAWMSPMKMFEYMSTGRPIIASALPVLREVLVHERNCLLVPPDDLDAWEEALRRLVDDEPLRERLGKNAREEVHRHYTWDARADAVLQSI